MFSMNVILFRGETVSVTEKNGMSEAFCNTCADSWSIELPPGDSEINQR